MRIGLAFKAFFQILFNARRASDYRALLSAPSTAATESPASTSTSKAASSATSSAAALPQRSDAISLLAALQREARLIDLVQESLDQYSDPQIGAAARDVLRDTKKVLDRMFAIQAVTQCGDGESMSTESEVDPGRIRLTGNVTGEPPFTGTVAHHGWQATRCEVPRWNGNQSSQNIIAPIELEIS